MGRDMQAIILEWLQDGTIKPDEVDEFIEAYKKTNKDVTMTKISELKQAVKDKGYYGKDKR